MSQPSKTPFIGPRNADASERGMYQIKDFVESQKVAFMAGGISIVSALLLKSLLKTETIQAGSVKKAAKSFVIISASIMLAHEASKRSV